MSEKIITVLSNASLDHYPDNKISNFRNKLYAPISLNSGDYEIAMLSCSYNASEIVVYEDEEIGRFYRYDSDKEEVLRAPFAMTTFEQLFTYIKNETDHNFEIDAYGHLQYFSTDPNYKTFTFSKRLENVLGITAVRVEARWIDPEKYLWKESGQHEPHVLPIHYEAGETIYWLKCIFSEEGKLKEVNHEVKAEKPLTFHEMMMQFAESCSRAKTNETGVGQWQVIMEQQDFVRFNKCTLKLNAVQTNEDGQVVTIHTVTCDVHECFLLMDEYIGRNANGEDILCSKDLFTFKEVLQEVERLRPGMFWFCNVQNRLSVTVPANEIEQDILKDCTLSEKITRYLGFQSFVSEPLQIGDFKSYVGAQRPVMNLGRSQLMVYCNLIHPQYVGNTVAPLLRSFQMQYGGSEHVFSSPLYYPITQDYLDVIHMYIRCENGEPPPFECGTFAATLGIRKRQH